MKTYYMAIELLDPPDGEFQLIKVQAVSVEVAVLEYLEYNPATDISNELTVEGDAGMYFGEEATIGIGLSKEVAALQYFKTRMEQG